jgi:hypothetical protein
MNWVPHAWLPKKRIPPIYHFSQLVAGNGEWLARRLPSGVDLALSPTSTFAGSSATSSPQVSSRPWQTGPTSRPTTSVLQSNGSGRFRLIILIQFAPESAWFLVRAGKLAEAEKSVARIQKKGSRVEPRGAVAMMVRTNEHEKAVSAGATYRGCFKGSDLRRTEIVCVAWASQTLAG